MAQETDRTPRPDARQTLGKYGEDVACEALVRRGYAVLERRFRLRGGEIDIVARDGRVLVFVEVKTRAGPAFGEAAAAVTPRKQHRLTRLAGAYLARRGWTNVPCRFDVVTVDVTAAGTRVQVFQHAFDAC